jgi:hypothetical protein
VDPDSGSASASELMCHVPFVCWQFGYLLAILANRYVSLLWLQSVYLSTHIMTKKSNCCIVLYCIVLPVDASKPVLLLLSLGRFIDQT